MSEASQAPAAYAAGIAFVGTVVLSRVKGIVGRSTTDDADDRSDDRPDDDRCAAAVDP